MRLSRSMLFLVSALALPVVAAGGCGDDSGDSNDKPSDQPSDDDNGGGEIVGDAGKKDAGSSKMDATVTPGSGDSGSSATTSDAGETTADAGSATVDAGAATDAAAEGIDAATDAGKDAGTDAGKDAAGDKVDAAGEPEKDASEPEQDASEPAKDAASDSATTDAGSGPTPDPVSEQDCKDGNGTQKDDASQCEDGQTAYPVIDSDKVCCAKPEAQPSDDGTCSKDVRCPAQKFCDYAKSNGGDGCDDPQQAGKCRDIPNDACDGVPPASGGCGCDGLIHTACDGWKASIPVELGDFSCFTIPLP